MKVLIGFFILILGVILNSFLVILSSDIGIDLPVRLILFFFNFAIIFSGIALIHEGDKKCHQQ